MLFPWNNHTIQLQGLLDSLEEVSSTQLQHLQSTNNISELCQLQLHTAEHTNNIITSVIPSFVLPLLSKYESIFSRTKYLTPHERSIILFIWSRARVRLMFGHIATLIFKNKQLRI